MMIVVQRMTLLMSLCILVGLNLYVRGRMVAASRPYGALALMTVGVGFFGLLGTFFKEPAVMICAYVLALELTLLREVTVSPRWHKAWFGLFIILPLIAVPLYFLHDLDYMRELYLIRDFTLGERLLTESRVLLDYLRIILAPSLGQTGPFQDDFVVSRSLFDPVATVFSVVAIIALLSFAFLAAKRVPVASFGIFWFFFGHALESTFLPLELYFEHRNYLPSLGIIFAVIALVLYVPRKLKPLFVAGVGAFLSLTAFVSFASSAVWGDERLIAQVWSAEHPRSVRAQINAVNYWIRRDPERALFHLKQALEHNPSKPGLHIHQFLGIRCGRFTGLEVSEPELEKIIPSASFDHLAHTDVVLMREGMKSGECDVSPHELIEILDLLLENPKYSGSPNQTLLLNTTKAKLYRDANEISRALSSLDDAYRSVPRFDIPLEQAWYAYLAARYDEALQYIEKAKAAPTSKPYALLWKDDVIGYLEHRIKQAQGQEPASG
jgi:hypothetical protein